MPKWGPPTEQSEQNFGGSGGAEADLISSSWEKSYQGFYKFEHFSFHTYIERIRLITAESTFLRQYRNFFTFHT